MWSWEPQQTAIYGGLACPLHISGNFTLHDVECARLGNELVEDVHIGSFAVGYVDKRRNIAVQVEQGVHLHSRLMTTKLGPGKQRKTEVNGGRVQSVQAFIQLHANGIVCVQAKERR